MPQYCLVKHRISTYVIDGADSDRNPDRVPVTGTVTFEALLDKGDSVVVTEDGVATTITLSPIEARITNGEIYHRGEEGVKLFAGGPDTNPERIRYRAKFTNLIAGGRRIDLKDILFEAVPGGELTLSMAQPVPGKPYPGYSATIEQGIALIEGARDEALGQVDGAVAAAMSEIEGLDLMERSTAEALLAGKADQDDPRLPLIMNGEYAAVIGDGDRAALAVTLDGSVDFRRATPGTKEAIMGSPDAVQASQDGEDYYAFQVSDRDGNIALAIDRSGAVDFRRATPETKTALMGSPDAVQASQGGDDHYVFQVSDRDGNVALAIDRSGALDFRRVTPEVAEHLRAIIPQGPGTPTDPTPTPEPEPGGSSRDVWVPDVDGTALHATHLGTGKRVLLSTTTTESRQVGDAIVWDEAGVQMYQKRPDEPSWRATDRTRIAFWGSSSIQESHGQLAAMASSFGITDVRRGGLGSDRGRHILGRMGAVPFALAHDITIPASGTVEFDTTNGSPVNMSPHSWTPGTLGGVQGQVSHRGARFTFQRDADGDAVQVPAGAQFIPDAISYRDAPAILQIGKNDISSEGAGGEAVLEQTETAYQWLRTLPEWVAVLGHHVNSNWEGGSDAALRVKHANDLCRERYQDRFIDLNTYLCSPEVWDHTGLTPTQEDLDRQAAGVMPLALARDTGAHMNDTAKVAYVNHLIIPHLNQIGWF